MKRKREIKSTANKYRHHSIRQTMTPIIFDFRVYSNQMDMINLVVANKHFNDYFIRHYVIK